MTYSYDPTQIRARGKDQMRFELGDTLVDGGADTCALADEEYIAVLDDLNDTKRAWLSAKLAVLEAILLKMMYGEMWKTVPKNELFGDDNAMEIWRDMYREELTKNMAMNGGIGLQDYIYQQLTQNTK